MRKTLKKKISTTRLDFLEPAEKSLLSDYFQIIRLSRPLTETRKIYWLRRLPQMSARQRLIQHYLPLVLELALECPEQDLMAIIQIGNRALVGAIRSGHLTPWDDLDYLIQAKIRAALSTGIQKVS